MDQIVNISFTKSQLSIIVEALYQDDTQTAHDLIEYIEIQLRKN
jgi:hypothetical protein